jgi:ankyrin repeat protein
MIEQLLASGADATAAAEDGRRPYDIAVAAGHRAAALALRDAAGLADPEGNADYKWRPYCRAYPLAELRRYPGWPDQARPRPGPGAEDGSAGQAGEIVFLHDDLTVTASMWPGEDVIFDVVTGEWARFCAEELGFAVPDEIDLIPAERPGAASG